MSMADIVANRLRIVVADGFDIFKISKEALSIYQDPKLSLTKDLDIALLSLIAMVEAPEFEMTEKEFYDFSLTFDRCSFQYIQLDQALSTPALRRRFAPFFPPSCILLAVKLHPFATTLTTYGCQYAFFEHDFSLLNRSKISIHSTHLLRGGYFLYASISYPVSAC
ncbi:hypothetical protein V2L05_05815 [Pseudomonas alliivorans]|uniref:hypothetical protein n=1 Tax=Pseudomonas alliivorans TaxID=2810613 RepID=UPI001AEB0C14|nr:hypothetical protein [Pseudomonas alliivorans]MBP0943699.1 hypothetical protein [Pseudomonas alliivorans]MEE4664064.1 hypothetical protein [Pseudomonas alliivorans]MEE4668733.1 hypothetical protein [Pseudomonas alliivorans]MEE4681205.1 hypothetical protein [Pseudomonas alliivorans]MEE4804102.1 hypothetical protein [Pseudomonas alliivorans]